MCVMVPCSLVERAMEEESWSRVILELSPLEMSASSLIQAKSHGSCLANSLRSFRMAHRIEYSLRRYGLDLPSLHTAMPCSMADAKWRVVKSERMLDSLLSSHFLGMTEHEACRAAKADSRSWELSSAEPSLEEKPHRIIITGRECGRVGECRAKMQSVKTKEWIRNAHALTASGGIDGRCPGV